MPQNDPSTGRLGPYHVGDLIGRGGMGEVYRARDTRLQRDVAIKILPAALSSDPERLARFEREAQLLASLNHPNIATIHGMADGPPEGGPHTDVGGGPHTSVGAGFSRPVLVMELVEGETLAERIARGPIAVVEAIRIATQIADALDAAHGKGIIHRDLKPANIKVTPDGVVKVLDFGLAKLVGPPEGGPHDDRVTLSATREGVVMGTPGYMSPEQARGQVVDKRADIWAFGCVLYEMLTGRPAFAGATTTDTLAAVIEHEPNWTALPAAVPPTIAQLIRRCLQKDPRRRLRDIGDVAWDVAHVPTIAVDRKQGRTLQVAALLLAAAAGAAAAAGWLRMTGPAAALAARVQFLVPPPDGQRFVISVESLALALSPNGQQLAFAAADARGPKLWVRRLDEPAAQAIPGTEGATSLFWSRDGAAIGFFAGGKLNRLDVASGAVVNVCDVPAGVGLSGTWGADDMALFGTVEGQGLFRVSMGGGQPVSILTANRDGGETRLVWPSFLPDGRRFLYMSGRPEGDGRLMMTSEGGRPQEIMAVTSNVQYVEPGYLVFAREGALVTQRFDPETGRVSGEAVGLANEVLYFYSTGLAMFSAASLTGALAFQPNRDASSLSSIDRNGREVETFLEPANYGRPRLSPDGNRALFSRIDARYGTQDIGLLDLSRRIDSRLTSYKGAENSGVWVPGGREFFFMINRGGPPNLFKRDVAGTFETEMLPRSRLQEPQDVSPDGKELMFTWRAATGQYDLWTIPVGGGQPQMLRQTRFDEVEARYSIDGRAYAFQSNESGRHEIYVAARGDGEPVPVSSDGGRMPRWSRAGRELFFIARDGALMAAEVRSTRPVAIGAVKRVFVAAGWPDYDVGPDGRFLAVVRLREAAAQPLTVVSSWPGPRP